MSPEGGFTEPNVIWNSELGLPAELSQTVSVDVRADKPSCWIALVIGTGGGEGYLCFRIKTGSRAYQGFRLDDGEPEGVISYENASATFEPGKWYTLTVKTGLGIKGNYRFTVREKGTDKILNPVTSFGFVPFPGDAEKCYAGFAAMSGKGRYDFDNFRITDQAAD